MQVSTVRLYSSSSSSISCEDICATCWMLRVLFSLASRRVSSISYISFSIVYLKRVHEKGNKIQFDEGNVANGIDNGVHLESFKWLTSVASPRESELATDLFEIQNHSKHGHYCCCCCY